MALDIQRRRTMVNSFVWTAEEAKYLKAVLRWQDAPANPEEEQRLRAAAAAVEEAERNKRKPVGEFRILVIGAKGVGKTSILTRFGNNTFLGEESPPDPFYERGCRHPVEIDNQIYTIDALEFPSKHLLSNPMLEQALAITEAAVLVYNVCDPSSLSLAEGIADFMREALSPSPSSHPPSLSSSTNTSPISSPTPTPTPRDYPLILVGSKSDIPSDPTSPTSPISPSPSSPNHTTPSRIPYPTASRLASTIRLPTSIPESPSTGCAFLEVSAKTGENVEKIFPELGKEILRLKRLGKQRRELAERVARERAAQGSVGGAGGGLGGRKKGGFWRILGFGRRGHQVVGGVH